MIRKSVYVTICILLLLALAGCGEPASNKIVKIIGPDSINVNTPKRLIVSIDDKPSTEKSTWKVEPSDGATVSDKGTFMATKPGTYKVMSNGGFGRVAYHYIKVTDSSAPALLRQKSSTNAYKSKKEKQLFYNGNSATVYNGGKSPQFKLEKTTLLTLVQTYHWNDAKGTASTGKLSIKDSEGKVYGPWKTSGAPGMGGKAKNAYWIAKPNIELPAGTYTVIDSDPSTWAQNSISKGVGMVWVFGKQ